MIGLEIINFGIMMAIGKGSSGDEVVAYNLIGCPVSRGEYIKMLDEADERISLGNFTSIEDLEKEAEKW